MSAKYHPVYRCPKCDSTQLHPAGRLLAHCDACGADFPKAKMVVHEIGSTPPAVPVPAVPDIVPLSHREPVVLLCGEDKRVWLRRVGDRWLWWVFLPNQGVGLFCERVGLVFDTTGTTFAFGVQPAGYFPPPDQAPNAPLRGYFQTFQGLILRGVVTPEPVNSIIGDNEP